ncbi:protein tirA-like isoform X5 [Branchiostoma floridae]|nr:protein tirA-like isoform X5 [Branchiostoma floridae]
MFNKLEDAGVLKTGNLSFLADLMAKIGRQVYADELNELAEREKGGKSPEKEVTLTMESTPDPGPVQVFLSYQWDHQKQVIQLRDVLEKKGYSCWMDITKMGGGDKLHAEIDRGIRQAKVVISCVTPNYTKSDSCQNEVELAYRLKKPLVPVLLEKTAWPPEGPMAMPFAQLLYIDFTKESKEHPWKGAKLNDLITSLEQRLKE